MSGVELIRVFEDFAATKPNREPNKDGRQTEILISESKMKRAPTKRNFLMNKFPKNAQKWHFDLFFQKIAGGSENFVFIVIGYIKKSL